LPKNPGLAGDKTGWEVKHKTKTSMRCPPRPKLPKCWSVGHLCW